MSHYIRQIKDKLYYGNLILISNAFFYSKRTNLSIITWNKDDNYGVVHFYSYCSHLIFRFSIIYNFRSKSRDLLSLDSTAVPVPLASRRYCTLHILALSSRVILCEQAGSLVDSIELLSLIYLYIHNEYRSCLFCLFVLFFLVAWHLRGGGGRGKGLAANKK